MSGLRDARLQRALADAPDAQLLPGARTREAVLDAARAVVTPAPVPRAPWWKKLWQTSGDRRAPWNAAFATLVLASLVTVLWYEREIPGARTTNADVQPSQSPRSTTPAPAPQAPLPGTVSPPAMVAASRPVAASPRAVQPESPTAPVRPTAPAAVPQAPAAAVAPAQAPRELRGEGASDALRDQNVGALSKSAPQVAEPSRAAEAGAQAAPSAAAPPTSGSAARRAPLIVNDWTQLRLTDQARSVEVTREQAGPFADLVRGMLRNAQGTEPLAGTITLRIEFRRAGELSGLLEVADAQVRWTRWQGAARESFTARPSAAQMQALREEIERLLQR